MRTISISTSFDYSIQIDLQIPMIKEAGFSHVSIGGNYEHSGILDNNRRKSLKESITNNGLSIDTIHGYVMDKADTIEINQEVVNAAAYLGAPIVVIHCSSFTFNSSTLEDRKKDIDIKIPLFEGMSKQSGVKFAIENVLPGIATDFAEFVIGNTNPKHFGFCYDSSHDQVDGPRPFDLLERQKHRLIAVHISDRIKEFTDHVIPGEGFIDFVEMCEIIKNSPFRSPFLMETMITNSQYKNPIEFIDLSYKKALGLYDLIY